MDITYYLRIDYRDAMFKILYLPNGLGILT